VDIGAHLPASVEPSVIAIAVEVMARKIDDDIDTNSRVED
jgi:hypothetical protein